jgi:hypothetical protein
MIKVVEKQKSKKAKNPYYKLKFNYMIGDADGHTDEEMTVSVGWNDELIERFVKLINSLKPLEGTWGIVFDHYEFDKFKTQLNDDDFNFLKNVMFEDWDDDEDEEEGDKNNGLFADCIQGEAEYSFLVFEGVDLYYYDENGVKHDTEFI